MLSQVGYLKPEKRNRKNYVKNPPRYSTPKQFSRQKASYPNTKEPLIEFL